MKNERPEPVHAWLVMLKASQAITKYAAADLQNIGLGDSDFRVLEVLLHKGPLPVNTIGPMVNLTPGSISVAVDRLWSKGFVSRIESADDRRVRIVALTPDGEELIIPAFQRHAALMAQVFSELASEELLIFEKLLKKVGRQAERLSQADPGSAKPLPKISTLNSSSGKAS